jgi:hypothetical protein
MSAGFAALPEQGRCQEFSEPGGVLNGAISSQVSAAIAAASTGGRFLVSATTARQLGETTILVPVEIVNQRITLVFVAWTCRRSARPRDSAVCAPHGARRTHLQTEVETRIVLASKGFANGSAIVAALADAPNVTPLPFERRNYSAAEAAFERLAELLADCDVEILKDVARGSMGENTLRSLASDLAYLET